MPTEQDIKNLTASVEDAVTYPILTRETSGYGSNGSSNSAAGAAGQGSQGRLAQQTIREVLGWRFRANDTKGFLAALNKAFALKEVEGHIEWDWKPQSYMLQADLGQITGAQASVHKQATVLLEQALPLLDGLQPLRADADAEDTEAMRAIVRMELKELVNELAMIGGPRVQRVDGFFNELIGPLPPQSFDPELVSGQLDRLRERFGLSRAHVNTITEEQGLTNFLILVDYVNSLYQSWNSKRSFFDGTSEPFLGTQLVLLSQVLDAILEQLRETYDAMDSVFFGPAERQTTELELPGGSMTVAEILSWVETFAAVEGRQLIQDAGKDGVVIFRSTMEMLTNIVGDAADVAAIPSTNPARPFHTKRVANALAELASHLTSATYRASEISRTPLRSAQKAGDEENLPSRPAVRRIEWSVIQAGEWVTRKPGDTIELKPGDKAKVILFGRFLRNLSLDLGDEVEVKELSYDRAERRVEATVQVAATAAPGTVSLTVNDADDDTTYHTVDRALTIGNFASSITLRPWRGNQGQQMTIEFHSDANLRGSGVSFGDGIAVNRLTYPSDKTMTAEILIDATARPGKREVTLFACPSMTLRTKFVVDKAQGSPPESEKVVPA